MANQQTAAVVFIGQALIYAAEAFIGQTLIYAPVVFIGQPLIYARSNHHLRAAVPGPAGHLKLYSPTILGGLAIQTGRLISAPRQ